MREKKQRNGNNRGNTRADPTEDGASGKTSEKKNMNKSWTGTKTHTHFRWLLQIFFDLSQIRNIFPWHERQNWRRRNMKNENWKWNCFWFVFYFHIFSIELFYLKRKISIEIIQRSFVRAIEFCVVHFQQIFLSFLTLTNQRRRRRRQLSENDDRINAFLWRQQNSLTATHNYWALAAQLTLTFYRSSKFLNSLYPEYDERTNKRKNERKIKCENCFWTKTKSIEIRLNAKSVFSPNLTPTTSTNSSK